jgi:hypothetical protein
MKVKQVVELTATEYSFWGGNLQFEDSAGNEVNIRVTDEMVHQLAKRFADKSKELRDEAAEQARLELESKVEDII